MRTLHLLLSGDTGGIETFNKDIYLHSSLENIYCFLFSGGKITDEMQEAGADVTLLDQISHKNIPAYCIQIQRLCKEKSIDHVVAHHAAPLLWIINLYLHTVLRLPCYLYVHGALEDRLRIRDKRFLSVRKFLFYQSAKHSKALIAISSYVKDSILRFYPHLAPAIQVVYNGVDCSRFQTAPGRDYPADTLLFVGRLIREKGVHVLIQALGQMEECPHCIIIGDGPERVALEELSRSLGLSSNISFMGVQRNIAHWHQSATLFVHPAIWEEGFGITLIEAMASGLPCAAFRKGAIPEIIRPEENGFIIDEPNPDALASHLSRILAISRKDRDRWHQIRANASSRARDFDITHTIQALDQLLQ